MNKLYHIVSIEDWSKFQNLEIYISSSFEVEQFIHLSTKNQVEGTLNNYYSNHNELLLLVINADLIAKDLKFETGPNGQDFPHLFSGLNKNVILEVLELRKNSTHWHLENYFL